MRHSITANQQHNAHGHPRPFKWAPWGCALFLVFLTLIAATLMAEENPYSDSRTTGRGFLEEKLGIAHDEMIMLIIALIVVFQIIVNFKLIRHIPCKTLLLAVFGTFVLSSLCTVLEGVFRTLESGLNFIEHLSYMVGAILLAVWCALAFAGKKKEGV